MDTLLHFTAAQNLAAKIAKLEAIPVSVWPAAIASNTNWKAGGIRLNKQHQI